MITSFLDKYTASIVIDRVLLNSNQIGKEILVTDPTQIKQHTIHHFQECTGGKPTSKIIPPEWKQQYEPKSYIRDDIYDNLMDAPSYEKSFSTYLKIKLLVQPKSQTKCYNI